MKYRVALLLVALGCLLAPALYAVETDFWQVGTFAEMLHGTLHGVSLTTEGELTLAPFSQTDYNPQEALALSIAADTHHNIYIGTGHQGMVAAWAGSHRWLVRITGHLVADSIVQRHTGVKQAFPALAVPLQSPGAR